MSSLPSISYGIAYFVLPHYTFQNFDRLIAIWMDTKIPGGPFFYLMGCQFQKVEPVKDHVALFKTHHGHLNDTTEYYLMEFPVPPPVELSNMDFTKDIPDKEMPVLAPHFSAVLRNRQTGAVVYYVLGQSPIGGGTTLRSVTSEGANCNLGPGPEPEIGMFLARIRDR